MYAKLLENKLEIAKINSNLVTDINIYEVIVDTVEEVPGSILTLRLQFLEHFLYYLARKLSSFMPSYWCKDVSDEDLKWNLLKPEQIISYAIHQLESYADAYTSKPGDYQYIITIFHYDSPSSTFIPQYYIDRKEKITCRRKFIYTEIVNIKKRYKDDNTCFVHPFLPVFELTAAEYRDMIETTEGYYNSKL